MTYDLYLGDPAYSSWSLRGWLLFDRFGLPFNSIWVDFHAGSVADQMNICPPARTVPSMRCSDGAVLWDSMALAEELATRHPDAGLWPSSPVARGTARSLTAEMHSGFTTLRNDCPMNLRTAYSDVPTSDALLADLRRLEEVWGFARAKCAPDGPWLCGDYSIADAFYAPVAARIAGYGLAVSASAQAYVDAHLSDPAFRRWRAIGQVRGTRLPWYDRAFPQCSWPGPVPLPARAVETGPSVNEACPFSGAPVTHFAEIGDRVVGFCNPGCRDKVVADPEVWPAMATVNAN